MIFNMNEVTSLDIFFKFCLVINPDLIIKDFSDYIKFHSLHVINSNLVCNKLKFVFT